MITMVLFLTLALAWNRQPLIASLAEHTQALAHAKDTIQAANQELVVVNHELQRRNAELIQLNDDLSHLLTEQQRPELADLDLRSTAELVSLMSAWSSFTP